MSFRFVTVRRNRLSPCFQRLTTNVALTRHVSWVPGSDDAHKTFTKKSTEAARGKEPSSSEKENPYKAGESYFSYHPYSFYDLDMEMKPLRLPQPNSRERPR